MNKINTTLATPSTRSNHGLLIALLASLSALGQFGSNVFLPGLPMLTQELQVSPSKAVLSYSLYLVCFGCTQLLAGPAADQWGRRPVALWGALIFVLGAIASAIAPSLPILLLARCLQGFGAAFTVVAARAYARDCFEGVALVRVMATMTIAFAAVPAFAPMLGGILAQYIGWRSTLWSSAVLGVAIGLMTWRYLHSPFSVDSAQAAQRSSRPVQIVYLPLLRNQAFLYHVIVGALATGAISAFFGTSPRLFMDVLKITPIEYGLYPPIAVFGFVLGGLLTRKLSGQRPTNTLLRAGVITQMAGIAVLLIPATFGLLHVWQINIGMVVFVTGLGVLMPVSMAQAMSAQSSHSGQAAALIGFAQMLLGALGTQIASALMDHWPALGMQLSMALFVLANFAWIVLKRQAIQPGD
jgi:MFS transporter, DHA1 family, multidrug resistance protein